MDTGGGPGHDQPPWTANQPRSSASPRASSPARPAATVDQRAGAQAVSRLTTRPAPARPATASGVQQFFDLDQAPESAWREDFYLAEGAIRGWDRRTLSITYQMLGSAWPQHYGFEPRTAAWDELSAPSHQQEHPVRQRCTTERRPSTTSTTAAISSTAAQHPFEGVDAATWSGATGKPNPPAVREELAKDMAQHAGLPGMLGAPACAAISPPRVYGRSP